MLISEQHPKLSIVIPLYNEAESMEVNIGRVAEHVKGLNVSWELVLVDDGSTDSTSEICHEMSNRNSFVRSISYPVNRGKGYAVKTGMLESSGEYIVFTDVDLAVPVRFIGNSLEYLEAGAPVVIGSRHLADSSFKVREGFLRQFLGEVFRRLAKASLGLRVSDITCGLKGFHKKAAVAAFSRSRIERWGYDAEIIFLAQRLGYDIVEMPVDWYHSFDSKVRVGIDSLRTLAEILRIRYYFLNRLYDC